MKDGGNMTDRKRNYQDPIGNPALFHRKKSYKSSGIWMDQMIDKAKRNTGLSTSMRSKSLSNLGGLTPKSSSATPKTSTGHRMPTADIWFNKMG
jgi:hypothetical protein